MRVADRRVAVAVLLARLLDETSLGDQLRVLVHEVQGLSADPDRGDGVLLCDLLMRPDRENPMTPR
jgi:hypothetical protein